MNIWLRSSPAVQPTRKSDTPERTRSILMPGPTWNPTSYRITAHHARCQSLPFIFSSNWKIRNSHHDSSRRSKKQADAENERHNIKIKYPNQKHREIALRHPRGIPSTGPFTHRNRVSVWLIKSRPKNNYCLIIDFLILISDLVLDESIKGKDPSTERVQFSEVQSNCS